MCVVDWKVSVYNSLAQGDEAISDILSVVYKACRAANVLNDLSAVVGKSRWRVYACGSFARVVRRGRGDYNFGALRYQKFGSILLITVSP